MSTNDKFEIEDRNLLRTVMCLSLATFVFLAFGIYLAWDLVSLLMEILDISDPVSISHWRAVAVLPGSLFGCVLGAMCMRHLLSASAERSYAILLESLSSRPLIGRPVAWMRMRLAVRHAARCSSARHR